MSGVPNNFRRRLSGIRDRINAQLDSLLEASPAELGEQSLVDRFEMFRNEQPLHGPARPRRTRRRNVTCTFKVTLLRTGIDRLSSLRDAIASQRLVVQREQSETQFAEILRSTFPQLQGREFELCRVDAQRQVSRLSLESKTPAAIIGSGQLGRSALYVQEKSTYALAQVNSSPAPAVASFSSPAVASFSAPAVASFSAPAPAVASSPAPAPAVASSPAPAPAVASSPAPAPAVASSAAPAPAVASSPEVSVAFSLLSPDTDIYISDEDEYDVDLKSLLNTMSNKVDFTAAPISNQINVTRCNILDSGIRAFRRQRFNPEAKLDVVFRDADGIGEGAADEGGPTREFLTLLMREIHSCEIFDGEDWKKTLACNSKALYNGMYKIVGRMIAVCLIHGGVEPNFFSERLFCQVCNLQPPVPDLQEIADYDFRAKMTKIQLAQNVNEAQCAIMEASDQLSMLGSLWHIQTLEDRDNLVESATKFFIENRLRDSLEQFKEGLECLGLLHLMQKHPQLFKEVFMYEEKPLLAEDISALFKAELSPVGSNRRVVESRTICFWRDWLIEVEEGTAYPLTLDKILGFVSGSTAIPRLGFPVEPKLEFLHPQENEAPKIFPEANTC
uniref:HECT domain-containing protein n=1 Tax=Cyprinus carpio carpio TaxID=630221 RepID=A0A9J7ZWW0_CYPCA